MKAAALSRRDRLRAQLADLKMPGALEALDPVLASVDAGQGTAAAAIEAPQSAPGFKRRCAPPACPW